VVVVGGGFGGLRAVRALARAPVQVTLLDRRNFHLFQPLLYQVATGGLSPANIAAPLRGVLKRQRNARVLLAEVTDFDVAGHSVLLAGGRVEYDTLIVATGARHSYFGNDDWERLATGLKTVEDATEIRRRVLLAFEKAESTADAAERAAWLTFVIVGGGPTGVELAGTIGELAHQTLRRNFRSIDPASARILLIEAAERILLVYPPSLAAKAAAALGRLGVLVRTKTTVTGIRDDAVTVRSGDGSETIPARTVLWAAGVEASPLGRRLVAAAGGVAAARGAPAGASATGSAATGAAATGAATGAAATDRAGRIVVGPDLTLPGHPEIFVIGDLALAHDADGRPLPGVAPVAIQEGRYVGRLIMARLRGRTLPPFRYRHLGTMATIGRAAAVAEIGWLRLHGYPAWLAWLFLHLMELVQFENRVLVFLQWTWNYITRNRSARLITGGPAGPRE
jgi:NADH dehydrogenase